MTAISAMIASAQPIAAVIISVALMLFFGFAMTRITKLLRLPNVTAYIVAGVLLSGHTASALCRSASSTDGLFVRRRAGLHRILHRRVLQALRAEKERLEGRLVTVLEAMLASVLVFVLTFWVLRLPLSFSVVLAALASATALPPR